MQKVFSKPKINPVNKFYFFRHKVVVKSETKQEDEAKSDYCRVQKDGRFRFSSMGRDQARRLDKVRLLYSLERWA
jgi:hypothetical protein